MTINRKNGNGINYALVVILCIGCMVRMVYLMENSAAPDFFAPILDPQLNDYWARALVTGDWTPLPHAADPQICTTPYGRPPAYPWLLAGIYAISKGSYFAPRILQMFIGLLNIVLVYFLGRRLFSAASGIVAAAMYAVYWAAVYFEGELNSPVWEVFLALCLILLLLRWENRGHLLWLFAAGIVLGLYALMRPNILLPGIFLCGWILYAGYMRLGNVNRALLHCGTFAFACMLTITPALVRNVVVANEFVLISYYGGINAYIGNNEKADGVSPMVPDLYEISGLDRWNCFTYPAVVKGLGKHLGKQEFGYADASRYFYGRAIDFWKNRPLKALCLTLRKAWFFWGPHEISDSKVIHYEHTFYPILRWLPGFSLMFAISLLGAFLLWLRKKTETIANNGVSLVVIYIAAYFLSVLPFFISGRYRFPVTPFLILFAGYAVVQLWEFSRSKYYKQAVSIILAGIALYALVSFPLIPYTPNLSTWYFHRGIAYAGGEEAINAFLEAVDVDPENDEAWLHLGYEYARQGHDDTAMTCYANAAKANPNNVYAQNNLGYEYFKQGQYEEAIQHYQHALDRQPEYTLALNNMGNALLELHQYEEALNQFEQVLRITPNDPHARYNTGNVYLRQELFDKAAECYQQAFQEHPDNPDIANNLGYALLRMGQADQAIPWFEKALSLAPDHALAHCNIAAAYEGLGDSVNAELHRSRCRASQQ